MSDGLKVQSIRLAIAENEGGRRYYPMAKATYISPKTEIVELKVMDVIATSDAELDVDAENGEDDI